MVACNNLAFHTPRPPLDIAARAEQGHDRSPDGGSHVHRHRVHADRELGLGNQRDQFLDRQGSGKVYHGRTGVLEDICDECCLCRIARSG